MKRQTILRFEEKQKNEHIGFFRITRDTLATNPICVENKYHIEHFSSLDEAELFYQSYVDFIRKVKKELLSKDKQR